MCRRKHRPTMKQSPSLENLTSVVEDPQTNDLTVAQD